MMKVLVAYDGSLYSKAALKYAIKNVKRHGGSLTALHVFAGPKFTDCDAGAGAAQRTRGESASHIEDAKQIIEKEANEIPLKLIWTEGIPAEVIAKYAADEEVDIVFSPPRFSSIAKKIFCPVYIISGNKVIAYDNVSSPTWRWSNTRTAELSSVG